MKKSFIKIISLLLMIGLNWAGLSAVVDTLAYYFDNEGSENNLFGASMLDFSVTNGYVESFIGIEATSEVESVSVITKTTGSLDFQYEISNEMISGNNDFCNALKIELEHNGIEKYDGLLLSVSAPITTQLGTWELELDLPVSTTNVPHGAECDVDLIFKGWRTNIVNFEDSGFTDEERINLRLTSRMIVLNEFLPRPDGWAYGFDFGDDSSSQPQGEWVELYNNSNTDYDLTGWYIWDASSDNSNKIFITNLNTWPETTIIPGGGWLVVYMNKAVLDNTGDTVKLFDNNDTLIDSYTYTGDSDYCEIEPTPGDENSTTTAGSCGGVPPNKSYARIPDGVGYWVDPIPTPGRANRLIEEEVKELVLEPEETTELEQEELTIELTNEVIEKPSEESIEQPISNEIFGEVLIEEEEVEEESVGEENPNIENEQPVSEGSNIEEESSIEEISATEEDSTTEESSIIEEGPIEEEVSDIQDEISIEQTTETSGETTNDVIEIEEEIEAPVSEATTDETIIDESTSELAEGVVEEIVSEPEPQIIEEASVNEAPVTEVVENPLNTQADEIPTTVVNEQPAAVLDDSSSVSDGTGESSDNSEGSGDISGSSSESGGESSGDSGSVEGN